MLFLIKLLFQDIILYLDHVQFSFLLHNKVLGTN